MNDHMFALRTLLGLKLIKWAMRMMPRGSQEHRELCVFITQSWIGKPGGQYVSTNRPSVITQEKMRELWEAKLNGC